jgi:hypothetical protein
MKGNNKMKKKSFLLLCLILIISFAVKVTNAAEVWINNDPNALIKRISIYHSDGIIQFPLNYGYIDIVFQNDNQIIGLPLQPITLPVGISGYELYAIYYCTQTQPSQLCDAVAIKIENGQLCAGLFRFNTLLDEPFFNITDIGCFVRQGLIQPVLVDRHKLQRLSKEELLDILVGGPKPVNPRGPVCLTCPPWDSYKKDIESQLGKLKTKKYKVSVQEVK